MSNARRPAWLRLDLLLFIACAILFVTFPQLDLAVAGWFYSPEEGFFYKHSAPVQLLYRLFAVLHIPMLLLFIAAGAYMKLRKYSPAWYRKKTLTFLMLSLILGPGLLVNTVLKDNSIGRARPAQVEPFGGQKTFTPAFVYSGECARNCSFVSGHAALGFYFIALGWILSSRRWFIAGFMVGVALGLVRIVQGGHFFSDVTFAFWAVYGTNLLLGRWLGFSNPLNQPDTQD